MQASPRPHAVGRPCATATVSHRACHIASAAPVVHQHRQGSGGVCSSTATSSSGCGAASSSSRSSSTSSSWACRRRRSVVPCAIEEASAVGAEAGATAVGEVRPAAGIKELAQVARLRAEAYYEDDRSRFVESFKKKFVGQEVEALGDRTRATARGAPLCECLVTMDPEDSALVLGCIDIRLPKSATGSHPMGVPDADDAGCYLLNVVVDDAFRGRGIGRALMRAAMRRAVDVWGAERLYTHVAADNAVAFWLYTSCGFAEHSIDSKFANTSMLGKLVLLQAAASAAL